VADNAKPEPAAATAAAPVAAVTTTEPKRDARTPVYKKWWLWTAVAVAAVGVGVGVGLGVTAGGSSAPTPELGTVGPSALRVSF
jgi:hypothetical protein